VPISKSIKYTFANGIAFWVFLFLIIPEKVCALEKETRKSNTKLASKCFLILKN
jgi:hypothetical protein